MAGRGAMHPHAALQPPLPALPLAPTHIAAADPGAQAARVPRHGARILRPGGQRRGAVWGGAGGAAPGARRRRLGCRIGCWCYGLLACVWHRARRWRWTCRALLRAWPSSTSLRSKSRWSASCTSGASGGDAAKAEGVQQIAAEAERVQQVVRRLTDHTLLPFAGTPPAATCRASTTWSRPSWPCLCRSTWRAPWRAGRWRAAARTCCSTSRPTATGQRVCLCTPHPPACTTMAARSDRASSTA